MAEIPKRLLYLDTYRGLGAFTIILAHAFSHIMFWDYNLMTIEEIPLWIVIPLAPLVLFATCAPVFVLISSTALSFNMRRAIDDQFNDNTTQNSMLVIRKSKVGKKFRSAIIGFLLLFGASFMHVSLFHYGLHWNGSIQRTLVTGSLEIGKFMWPDFEVLFQTDAIGLIALNGIVCSGILALLWRKEGYRKSKRNMAILIGLAASWFLFAPFLHSWLDPVFFDAMDQGRYLKVILLKFIIGPPQSSFPNLAYGYIGLIFGIGFAEGKDKIFFRKLGYSLSAICILGSGLYILFNGLDLDPKYFGLFLPIEIQILDIGYILLIQTFFIEWMEFKSPEKKKKVLKRTRLLKRFGYITMTIYIFESILCVLNLKWYMPLWEVIPTFSGDKIVQVFGFVILELVLWWLISKIWEKYHYKYSVEWIVVRLKEIIVKHKTSKLNHTEMQEQYLSMQDLTIDQN